MLRYCVLLVLMALPLVACQLTPSADVTAAAEATPEAAPETTVEPEAEASPMNTPEANAEIAALTAGVTAEATIAAAEVAEGDSTLESTSEAEAIAQAATSAETPLPTLTPTPAPTSTPLPTPGAGVIAWLRAENLVVRLSADGTMMPLIHTERATRVTICQAPFAVSDRRVLYVGTDTGTLYLIDGESVPRRIADTTYLACIAAGSARFNADEDWLGFVDYATNAASGEYAEGTLRIIDLNTFDGVASFERISAFTFTDDGAAMIRFFTDQRGAAVEAAVSVWTGDGAREVVTLTPTDDNCRFTGGQIGAQSPLIAVIGQRCTGSGTVRLLYTIDPANGSATLIDTAGQTGVFAAFAGTNNIVTAEGSVFFTIPDGITAYTTGFAALDARAGDVTPVIDRQIVLPNFSGVNQAMPARSRDGRWLGVSIASPNNDNAVALIDLRSPYPVLRVSAGSRGDTVSNLAFVDNRLIYTAGSVNSSLWALDPTVGVERRITRGVFGAGMVINTAGDAVIVVDREGSDPVLSRIELESGAKSIFFTGAALPLAWVGE